MTTTQETPSSGSSGSGEALPKVTMMSSGGRGEVENPKVEETTKKYDEEFGEYPEEQLEGELEDDKKPSAVDVPKVQAVEGKKKPWYSQVKESRVLETPASFPKFPDVPAIPRDLNETQFSEGATGLKARLERAQDEMDLGMELAERRSSGYLGQGSRTRSHNQVVKQAMRQSISGAKKGVTLLEPEPEEIEKEVEEEDRQLEFCDSGLILNGRKLTVNQNGGPARGLKTVRIWNKEERAKLPPDMRQVFLKHATGPILGKHNKLQVPELTVDNDKYLGHTKNLQSQLTLLGVHLKQYDMEDVRVVVITKDVQVSPVIEDKMKDLIRDYPTIQPIMVANSTVWFRTWVRESYVSENQDILFELLRNNTETNLWSRAMDEYSEYDELEQGGSLMLIIILKMIHNGSEQALKHLTNQLIGLNINKLKGEDVDLAVSFIKSAYKVFKAASTGSRSRVPADFHEVVWNILMTCSVRAFTGPLHHQKEDILFAADKAGIEPQWPSIGELLNMASNSYRRLKSAGKWDKYTSKKGSYFSGQLPAMTPRTPGNTPQRKPKPGQRCWNCGSDKHLLPDCPKPRDENKIDANRKKFLEGKKSTRRPFKSKPKGTSSPPSTKMGMTAVSSDGKPLILNKNGVYVLDQKAWKSTKSKTAPPVPPTETDSTTPQDTNPRATQVRSLLSGAM